MEIGGGHHFDIVGGLHSFVSAILFVFRHAVVHHFAERVIIADNHAVEAPFVAQDAFDELPVCRGGNAVERIERRHDHFYARIHGGFISDEIFFAQREFAHIHGVIISACFGGAVSGEMLHARRNAFALEAFYLRGGEQTV